jgi:capsular polysaccharide biosynthesis protein
MASTAHILTGLIRRWWLAGMLVVLGALAGLAYALLSPPTYPAKAYVVAQNPADSASAVGYAQAYARTAGQGGTLDAAAAGGGAPASAKELRRQIRVSASPDAPIIEVTGSARSAGRAAELANLVANGLVRTADRHSADTRTKLTMLGAASPQAEPASPWLALDVTVGAAVGLLVGLLAVLAGVGRPRTDASQDQPAVAVPAGPAVAVPAGPAAAGPAEWASRAAAAAGPAGPVAADPAGVADGAKAAAALQRWTGRARVTATAATTRDQAGPDGSSGTSVKGVPPKTNLHKRARRSGSGRPAKRTAGNGGRQAGESL